MGSNPCAQCPFKRKEREIGDPETEEKHVERGCDGGGRDWSDVPTSQGVAAAPEARTKHGVDSPLEPLEGTNPATP